MVRLRNNLTVGNPESHQLAIDGILHFAADDLQIMPGPPVGVEETRTEFL